VGDLSAATEPAPAPVCRVDVCERPAAAPDRPLRLLCARHWRRVPLEIRAQLDWAWGCLKPADAFRLAVRDAVRAAS
jgi:hypothetical protein